MMHVEWPTFVCLLTVLLIKTLSSTTIVNTVAQRGGQVNAHGALTLMELVLLTPVTKTALVRYGSMTV